MSRLPKELLSDIFIYLPKKNVFECMKVCKLWYSFASVIYFREVRVDSKPLAFLKACKETRIDASMIGDFVKTLTIFEDANWLLGYEFYELLTNLPHLQVIKASQRYMSYLKTASETYIKQVQQITMQPRHFVSDMISDHFYVNFRLKDQITTLKLTHLDIPQVINDYSNLLKVLSRFTQLKKLTLGSRGTGNAEVIHLESVLDACKHLAYLQLDQKSFRPPPINSTTHLGLKSLNLSVDQLLKEHVLYFMRCVPNLRKLRLETEKGTLEKLLTTLNPDTTQEFAIYLKQLVYVEINQGHPLLSNETADPETASQVFWGFMRIFSDQDCHCHLVADLLLDEIHGARFKKRNNILDIQCDILLDPFSPGQWTKQIDWLIFDTINISIGQIFNSVDTDIYDHVIYPLLHLLKQQKDKQPFCKIDFTIGTQELSFQQLISMTSGYLKNMILQDKLLHALGQRYPFTERLVLEECRVEQELERTNNYCIDLSQFHDMRQLVFDLDSLLDTKRTERITLYIKMINVKDPSKSGYYYYDLCKQNELYYSGEQHVIDLPRVDIPRKFIQLKILHVRLVDVIFRREGVCLPVIDNPNVKH